ncbi:MAG TPA: hypothetical protein VL688_13015 [Verrucomicrobiae bacterium]|nr:hypothetical protein [Verrucomicrobiae bacterium]
MELRRKNKIVESDAALNSGKRDRFGIGSGGRGFFRGTGLPADRQKQREKKDKPEPKDQDSSWDSLAA